MEQIKTKQFWHIFVSSATDISITILNGKVHPVVQVIISLMIAIYGASTIFKILRKFIIRRIMFGI